MVAAGAIAIQAILIVGLLFERRARVRAEIESRKNLSLAADTSRRVTMSALSGSMAHELSQPLSAMIYNAEALQLMINAQSRNDGEHHRDTRGHPCRRHPRCGDHRAPSGHAPESQDRKEGGRFAGGCQRHTCAGRLRHQERQIEVSVDLPANSCRLHGDPVLLEQVLVNLVINAMDAMEATPPGRRHITISSEARRNEIVIVVHDSGPGLPADLLGRLFTPFVTTKSNGVGIGLAIARTIVEAHGGSISARNSPVGGAIFTITLPARDAQEIQPVLPAIVDIVGEPPNT